MKKQALAGMPSPFAFARQQPAAEEKPAPSPVVVPSADSRGYSFPIYKGMARQEDLKSWVGVGAVAIRPQHLKAVPEGFDKLPLVKGAPWESAEQVTIRLLGQLDQGAVKLRRAIVFPANYAVELETEVLPLRRDINVGLYLTKDKKHHVFLNQAFGPPPKTVFTANNLTNLAGISWIADAEQSKDVGLLVAAFTFTDEAYAPTLINLTKAGFLLEAELLGYVVAVCAASSRNHTRDNRIIDAIAELDPGRLTGLHKTLPDKMRTALKVEVPGEHKPVDGLLTSVVAACGALLPK